MANTGTIREALAAALKTIKGFQVSPYLLANPTPPCAMVIADEKTFDLAMGRGIDQPNFLIRIAVPFSADIGSQVNLDAYRAGSGARSVKAALEKDKTLGGACQTLRVTSVSRDQLYTLSEGAAPALGCEFRVELYASGI